METYITLLRGVNVSGKNKLPMKELVLTLEKAGFQGAKTYIQTGNIIFKHIKTTPSELALIIAGTIEKNHGFRPAVITLSYDKFKAALNQNPFIDAENEPTKLHLYFLDTPPETPNLTKLNSLKTNTEQFLLHENLFYLYTPDGIGRSKLAAQIEKSLGVSATARNWRSVSTILDMATQD